MSNDQLTPIPDIAFRIDDDGEFIDLEQDAGIGEVNQITLHRIHLAHIAKAAGLLDTDKAEQERAARFRERLDLLAAMVMTHTRPGDPLRAVVTVLVPDMEAPPPASVTPPTHGRAPAGVHARDQQDMPAPVALPPPEIPNTDATLPLPGIE